MNGFSGLVFSDTPENYVKKDDKLVYVPDGLGKTTLLNYLFEALNFPSYFGNNWDALYDCLSAMYWIAEPRVILIHSGLPNLDRENLTTYLNILNEIALFEKDANTEYIYPKLAAVFPYKSRNIELLS